MVAVLFGLGLALSGCASVPFLSTGSDEFIEEDIVPPQEGYEAGVNFVNQRRFRSALKEFERVERQHPYSSFAEKSSLMSVYSHYQLGEFEKSVSAADRYLALHPASDQAAYAAYLKSLSLYSQIQDATRDQTKADEAIDAFNTVIERYPDSEYVADSKEKIVIARDQLAGKDMSVGRFYLGQKNYPAAVNRFRSVVDDHQQTTHIEEALMRLTEAYLAMGLLDEARTATAVLGHNYPSSSWYNDAYNLLQKQGLTPKVDPNSSLSTALQPG